MESSVNLIKYPGNILFSPLLLAAVAIALLLLVVLVVYKRRRQVLTGVRAVSSDLQLGAIPTFRRNLERLSHELARVRRYQRPLSIIVLRLESDQLLVDLKRTLVAESGNGSVESYNQIMQTIQLVFSLVGSILQESLRESDIPSYDVANNQYIIALPECTGEQASQTVTRLKKLLFKRTAGHLVAGIAEFPHDGLIIDDLVKTAMTSIEAHANGRYHENNNVKEIKIHSDQSDSDENFADK